jgi:hypothetical protein
MGFTFPLALWFRGAMRKRLADTLLGFDESRFPFLDRRAVARMWHGFLRGERYVSYARVWCLAALLEWCSRNRVSAQDLDPAGRRGGCRP